MALRAFSAGSAALVARAIRDLGIVETVDDMVKWDPKQCKHSPGTHVLAVSVKWRPPVNDSGIVGLSYESPYGTPLTSYTTSFPQ